MPIPKYFVLICASLFFLLAHSASAAVIYILPEQGNFARGGTVSIDIKINSEGEGVNAAQGKINWPAGVLEFMEASKEGSALSFWLEEPALSNASSSLSFIGGTAKGISGEALQILKVKFKALTAGTAEISVSDAAVTASDGKGTNVLSKVKGGSYRVVLEAIQPEVPALVRVERPATPAQALPKKPEMQVSQYPDEQQWHNFLGEVMVLWNVPSDITAVATALNRSPNAVPSVAEKELTTGRNFGILEDGIWYVHVRFRNSIGWGPAAHYRIAIDTKPPLPFGLAFLEGETTDNPAPVIRFKSSDTLSGLKEYEIKIDDREAIKVPAAGFPGSFTLPLQPPGTHRVVVRAIDEAGNSVEDGTAIEILPIPSPAITFVTGELFSEEERGLNVKGTALPNIEVLLAVLQGETRVTGGTTRAGENGNWEFTFNEPLRNGRYILTARSQDERGALSLTAESAAVRVKSKPIIQVGKLQLGMGGALIFLLAVIAGGFGGGVRFYKKRQEKLALRLLTVKNDMVKVFKIIHDDVEKLQQAIKTPTEADDEFIIKRLQENTEKMEGYLKKEMEKLE